jgi:hypothetical protein
MAIAKNPKAREFVVYQFEVRRIPFYVGIGRPGRATDRVRFVDYLMRREASGKSVKWNLSDSVIAGFLRRGEDARLRYLHKRLPRARALVLEKKRILALVAAKLLLANRHHNVRRPTNARSVIRAVLRRSKRLSIGASSGPFPGV